MLRSKFLVFILGQLQYPKRGQTTYRPVHDIKFMFDMSLACMLQYLRGYSRSIVGIGERDLKTSRFVLDVDFEIRDAFHQGLLYSL